MHQIVQDLWLTHMEKQPLKEKIDDYCSQALLNSHNTVWNYVPPCHTICDSTPISYHIRDFEKASYPTCKKGIQQNVEDDDHNADGTEIAKRFWQVIIVVLLAMVMVVMFVDQVFKQNLRVSDSTT